MIYFAATALWTYISYKENEKLLMFVAAMFFIKGIKDAAVGTENVISQSGVNTMKREKIKIILTLAVNIFSAVFSLFLSGCYFYISVKMDKITDLVYLIPALIFLGFTICDILYVKKKYDVYKNNKKEWE